MQELQPPEQSVSLRVSSRVSFRCSPLTTGLRALEDCPSGRLDAAEVRPLERYHIKKIGQFPAEVVDLYQENISLARPKLNDEKDFDR